MYTDPEYFLNGLLSELGLEQNADEWAYDIPRSGEWFTANHPDTGQYLTVFVEHVSANASGTTALTLHALDQ
jgi:hypothetical protein